MTENWYLVLELEFDPNPVKDEFVIKARIEEKKKFWTRNFNDFKHGDEYRKYVQLIPDIERDMIGPDNIQDELIKDAIVRTYEPIDRILKSLKATDIDDETINRIASKLKADVDMVKRRAYTLGITVKESKEEDYKSIYDKYYKNKPQIYDRVVQDKSILDSFGVSNIYEFLYAGSSVKNPQKLPCDMLRQRAKERETKEFYKSDSASANGKRLCQIANEYFKTDETKNEFDLCLEYLKIRSILKELRNIYELQDGLTYEVIVSYTAELAYVLHDCSLAERVLIAFCKVENIAKLKLW